MCMCLLVDLGEELVVAEEGEFLVADLERGAAELWGRGWLAGVDTLGGVLVVGVYVVRSGTYREREERQPLSPERWLTIDSTDVSSRVVGGYHHHGFFLLRSSSSPFLSFFFFLVHFFPPSLSTYDGININIPEESRPCLQAAR